jgi:hypothetical protein
MREGDWKLVRPMISGTRFFNKDIFVGEEDQARVAALVSADCRHKEDPRASEDILPAPRVKELAPEPVELYNLAKDPEEQNDLAAANPDRTRRMLRELETWFEGVEAERLTAPDVRREGDG